MPYGFIYITTNNINGKRYLGMCKYSKKNAKVYLGSGKALKRAIKKYGKENFSREVVFIAETKEQLSAKEIELIEEYSCVNDPNWYNISEGGYTTRGFTGRKHSEETRTKMRQNYKRELTSEGKKKIGDAARTRIAWVSSFRRDMNGGNHPRAKSVTIDNIVYDTITKAVKETGLSYYTVRKIAIAQLNPLL